METLPLVTGGVLLEMSCSTSSQKKLIVRADYYVSDIPESHLDFGVVPPGWGLYSEFFEVAGSCRFIDQNNK